MERVWQRDYADQAKAVRDITDYIVNFYNRCIADPTALSHRSGSLQGCCVLNAFLTALARSTALPLPQ